MEKKAFLCVRARQPRGLALSYNAVIVLYLNQSFFEVIDLRPL